MGNNITQKLKYKESVVKFSYKYGVTKAAVKFGECRRTVYRWRERYDGSLKSLKDKSRRPHYHPNQHTEEEIKMIKNYKILFNAMCYKVETYIYSTIYNLIIWNNKFSIDN